MKAPDKIYVLCDYDGRPGNVDIYPLGKRSQEYIRKEALLEWANGMMDCFAPGGDCSQTLQMVIKHIESL